MRIPAFLAVLACAAAAAAGETKHGVTESPRVPSGEWGAGIQAFYTQQVSKSWTCELGALSATCHGCTGACGLHTRKIERKDVEKRALEEIKKSSVGGGLESVLKSGLELTVKGVTGVTEKTTGSSDAGANAKAESSGQEESKSSGESTTGADVELGTKAHAPKCWTWTITGSATLTLTVHIQREITSSNFLVHLGESVEEKVQGCPVAAVTVENRIDEKYCCCASRTGEAPKPEAGAGAPGGSPGAAPEPPKKTPR
ncbi:MAG: hypothetical protein MUC63_06110, partial [Planctomycetes bacterium]|nr:hypothetical protein [Planctomycetota bacterium]